MPTPAPPPSLFTPISLGALQLSHRIVMPAMARRQASMPGHVPNALMAAHYAQRATPGGLIVCEAAAVSADVAASGVPGMHTPAQVNHWRTVTDAVHGRGGIVVAQLGHGCRYTRAGPVGHEPDLDEIESILQDYRNAAENAGDAGFDGVELQAAHGALPERFFVDAGPNRARGYGGTPQARTRFFREALQSLIGVWGGARVGACLSPSGPAGGAGVDAHQRLAFYTALLADLQPCGLAYLHLSAPPDETAAVPSPNLARQLRPGWPGRLIVSGGFDAAGAAAELQGGRAEAIAFGRAFVTHPDLPHRLRHGLPLAP